MRTISALAFLLLLSACATTSEPAATTTTTTTTTTAADPEGEVAASRPLFEANIRAIPDKDREAYLACYRQSDRLVRAGIGGPALGYADLADGTAATGSDDWPSKLEADEMELAWIAPGIVYGSYRYVVTIEGKTTTGLSERVFLLEDGAWKIAVSTAFEGDKPPPEEEAPQEQEAATPPAEEAEPSEG
jgi:hypothetical protein